MRSPIRNPEFYVSNQQYVLFESIFRSLPETVLREAAKKLDNRILKTKNIKKLFLDVQISVIRLEGGSLGIFSAI